MSEEEPMSIYELGSAGISILEAEIKRLQAQLAAAIEREIQWQAERKDMLTLLGWVSDCWPARDENWYRPDMEDCVDAIREFLAERAALAE